MSKDRGSSIRNPLELVDRYLQAVRFWLPKGQQDLIAELGEDLHSQIEAQETELGRPLDASEVSAILKRCGSPMVVAGRLRPQQYLIGPTLFPIYLFVLKMVLLWILLPVFLLILGPMSMVKAGGSSDWGIAAARTLADLWSAAFSAAGTITLIFAVLDRSRVHLRLDNKWDPNSLPPVRKQERKPSLASTIAELVFGFFGLIWLLLLPHYRGLILGPAESFLKGSPMWHAFYVPILLLAVAALLRTAITLAQPQWTWFPPLTQLLQTVATLIILSFILNAAAQTPKANWYPFVVLVDAAKSSAQGIRAAAVVNASILLSLQAAWLGLSVAIAIQTWRFLRYVRDRNANPHHEAPLQVH